MLLEGPREGVVPGAVVLRDEVEVRDLCRFGRALKRRLSGTADRRRRKAGELVRVVGRIDLEVLERGLAPLADGVLDRRVGIELHPDLESVRVDPRDGRALLPVARLSLDDRTELHDVVDRGLAINGGLPQRPANS